MAPRWRLEVEGLGRLERAEVDIHPLMLFVGPNNTGKSYLASLLWGLLALQSKLRAPDGPERAACEAWLKQAETSGEGQLGRDRSLTAEEQEMFARCFEAALREGKTRLVRETFNTDAMDVARLEVRRLGSNVNVEISKDDDAPGHVMVTVETADWSPTFGMATEHLVDHVARSVVLGEHVLHPVTGPSSKKSPLYLPASRTGFMQLYKAAFQRSFWEAFRRESGEWLDLTLPAAHFINMLALGFQDNRLGPFADEAALLEEALSGTIELASTTGINDFRFRPREAHEALAMSRSSALVTELAPLILVLRHLYQFPVLILEEPEAHLHPELQLRLAQVIVRLIRKGVYVWITTHSENFCQQINNFIKIGSLDPERREAAQQHLGYAPQDFLELDDVVGYQFKIDDTSQRSSVLEMEKTPYGLAMPTFNATILRLAKDVDYLDQLVAGE